MTDVDDELAAAAALADFVPIGNDHPHVVDMAESLAEMISAAPPSPRVPPDPAVEAERAEAWANLRPVETTVLLERISSKLDEIITLLRGGTP